MKKLVSLVAISVLIGNMAIPVSSAETGVKGVADFGESSKFSGISGVVLENGSDASTTVTVRGGRKGYEIPISDKSIYIDFEDTFLSNLDDGTEVRVDIEYYDQNDGHFMVLYDSLDGRSLPELVVVKNTNQWKTKSIVIDDGYFGGNLEGHDMKITLQDTELNSTPPTSVVIDKITVTKYPGKNPIRSVITSDEAGNIFSPADENIMKVKYHNFSQGEEKADVLLEVVRDNGDVVLTMKDEISLEAKSETEKEYKLDLTEFGLYSFRVTVSNENIHSVTERAMSYVNTDPDGIRNEKLLAVTHWDWRGYIDFPLEELVRKLNAGGVRDNPEWAGLEAPMGVYAYENYPWLPRMHGEGMTNSLWIAAYGNLRYTDWQGNGSAIPWTKEYQQAYANFVADVAKTFEGKISKIEMWNEPVLWAKNNTGDFYDTAKLYRDLMKYTYETVKATGVDVMLGGMSHCGYQSDVQKEWYRRVMEAGGWKYMDAITGHPYARKIPLDQDPAWVDMFIEHCMMVEDYGGSIEDYEIWLTEMGLTLTDADGDELMQSKCLTRDYIYMESIGYNDLYSIYDLIQDGINPVEREHRFGITKHHRYPDNKVPLSANDAFLQMANLNYYLADSEYQETVKVDDMTNMYIYNSNKFGEKIGVFWTKEGEKTISFDLGCDSIELVDEYGNATVVNGKDGIFTFVADEFTTYVKGNFTKCVPVDKTNVELNAVSIKASGGDRIDIRYESEGDIRVEAEKIASNVEIINDDWQTSGVITLALPKITEGSTTLRLNFYEGDRCIQSSDVKINYDKRLSSDIKVTLPDTNNLNTWQGIITVENNSSVYNMNGYIEIVAPNSYTGDRKIPTGPIPPRKKAQIKVDFANIIKKGMYNFDYNVVLNDGTVEKIKNVSDLTVAKRAEKAPVIDGKVGRDEWNLQTYMYSEDASQIKNIKGWGGVNDLSARTNIMWDDDYWYMLVVAKDDIQFNNADTPRNIWQGDSVQFGVVFAPEMEVTVMGQRNLSYTEMGMARTNDGVKVYRWSSEDGKTPTGEVTNCECKVVRGDNGETVYELKVPWSEIVPQGYKFNPKRQVGFSMLVNDNDGSGRRGWIEYASGIGLNKNTTLFTYLQMIE